MSKNSHNKLKIEKRILYSIIIFLVMPIPHQVIGFEDSLVFDFTIGYNLLMSNFFLIVPSAILSLILGGALAWFVSPFVYRWLNSSSKIMKIKNALFVFLVLILAVSIFVYPILLPNVVEDFDAMDKAKETGDPTYCFNMPLPLPLISDPMIRQNAVEWRDLCFLKIIEKTQDNSYCKYVRRPGSDSWGFNYNQMCPTDRKLDKCADAIRKGEKECKQNCIHSRDNNPESLEYTITQYSFNFHQGWSYCNCLTYNNSGRASSKEALDEKSEQQSYEYCGDTEPVVRPID
ncbi:hypothetical protein HYX02_00890 [Candidatus Woesearchaeota archaeon]|nr:hypothetical protein [Candidatus Woesearchaeota archaeon]